MKNSELFRIVIMLLIIFSFSNGCVPSDSGQIKTFAIVQKGNLAVKITADGYIEMPEAVNLYFDSTMFSPPYSGRIKDVYVEAGDQVKAGTLLAKLDDTSQKLQVESAQYALELAINNVVQTVCCGTPRVPTFYSDSVALLRYEFAMDEIAEAFVLLEAADYVDASAQLALARADIEAAMDVYINPEYNTLRTEFSEAGLILAEVQDVVNATDRLSGDLERISFLQQMIKEGNYHLAIKELEKLQMKMKDSYLIVKRINHLPGNYTYADTATAFTVIRSALAALDELGSWNTRDSYDDVKYAETLSTVRHDLEMTDRILDENVSTYRQGLNLKTLRDYNIGIQNAIINLERAKQALLRTEIFAPFDGKIIEVNLHAGDMITQRYSVTGAPIDTYVIKIANTGNVKFKGVIDEIDAVKMAGSPLGQLSATIIVDAWPNKEFKGRVKFISNYGSMESSSIQYYGTAQPKFATYDVEIEMDSQYAAYLTGGLSATAQIEIENLSDILLIPDDALSGKAGAYTVRVCEEGIGNIELRQVTTGAQSGGKTEIIAGLSEGEKVLIDRPLYPSKLQTTIE